MVELKACLMVVLSDERKVERRVGRKVGLRADQSVYLRVARRDEKKVDPRVEKKVLMMVDHWAGWTEHQTAEMLVDRLGDLKVDYSVQMKVGKRAVRSDLQMVGLLEKRLADLMVG